MTKPRVHLRHDKNPKAEGWYPPATAAVLLRRPGWSVVDDAPASPAPEPPADHTDAVNATDEPAGDGDTEGI